MLFIAIMKNKNFIEILEFIKIQGGFYYVVYEWHIWIRELKNKLVNRKEKM